MPTMPIADRVNDDRINDEVQRAAPMKCLQSLRELRHVPERFAYMEHVLRRLLDITLLDRQRVPPPLPIDPTFVYLIPPEGGGAMMVQCARVSGYAIHYMRFTPFREIPAGSWIIACGPALVAGVKVGNCMQSSMSDYQGHVCKTVDAIPLGVVLTVELRTA